jgi:hypothetical protein
MDGCNEILTYSEYLNHLRNCKYNQNMEYECNIKKYNYNTKEFEICGLIGNKKNIEKHLHICAFTKYQCLFCKEKILQMNLEIHAEKECKIRIIKLPYGYKYIGEVKNNIFEGYGIQYLEYNDMYKGEFKDGKMEGYGMLLFSNGVKYVGEFKNSFIEGNGIIYYLDGSRFEGEILYNQIYRIGIIYLNNGKKYYEGEIIYGKKQGFGILYYDNGETYEGEFNDDMKEGFGI